MQDEVERPMAEACRNVEENKFFIGKRGEPMNPSRNTIQE